MKKVITNFLNSLIPQSNQSSKSHVFWKGASLGLISVAFLISLFFSLHAFYGMSRFWIVLLFILGSGFSFLVFPILVQLIIRSIRLYPVYFVSATSAFIGLLLTLNNIRSGIPDMFLYLGGLVILILTVLAGGGVALLLTGKLSQFSSVFRTLFLSAFLIAVGGLSYTGYWLMSSGNVPNKTTFRQQPIDNTLVLDLPDPSRPGSYKYTEFSYGSGVNKKRSEFGKEASYISSTVNGTFLLPSWKKKQGRKRAQYWGYDISEWPLNGLVWMPEGEGPFPIVLIVHGNHNMEDYSDPGYAYLGELLASRGFITVSVDENFINGSWAGDFRGKELPARAWLLLKHLEQWRLWSEDLSHPLSGKADLDKIVLIGHSRGGEAVPIAAAFNNLSHFPDDAREKFDFNFGIKGVVAIAPTDYRYDRRVSIENVNYLGIQGSYDSDEDSFFGLRQLQRTHFLDSGFHLKSGVYIYGANHGQFNSSWGRYDFGFPGKLFLNTEPLISGEDQRQIAKVTIGAFLEISLNEKLEYIGLFQDLRAAGDWLPEDVSTISIYEDSRMSYWADFEEDIELTSVLAGDVTMNGFDFWSEDYLQYRGGRHQENHALVLGWNRDSLPETASYSIQFDSLISLKPGDEFTLSIGSGDPSLLDDVEEDSLKNEVEIVFKDMFGNESRIRLDSFKTVAPRHLVRFMKTKELTLDRYSNEWEPVLETMFIPVSAFEGLDLESILGMSIQARTDAAGIVLIDRVGVRRYK